MGLDSRYVIAPSLQEYFVDKDSGLPLSGGQVFFFVDTARSVPKDVFEISGSSPSYTYTVLPNPVTLSAVGTFQDGSGNDIIPYYFPFVSLTDNTPELYYIEVYNSLGVLQFTREGWPNTSTSEGTGEDVTNFVPNGQFLLHDNVPASAANGYVANKLSQDVTIIAQGGWTFERGPSSTATDFVTFPRYGSAITSPTGSPRYAFQIQTTIAGSDTRKDLCLTFPDVNKFSSNTQAYNFYFEGQSKTGSAINNVQIIVRKFFGTGGSPSATTETVITSISLSPNSITKYNTSIIFGTNENKSIGTNNDDYVQILLRFPPTGIQTALVTDFCLTISNSQLSSFPTQTNAEQLDESTAGWFPTPDPNGFDLYLPAVLTPSGLTFSHADIGKIYAAMYETLPIGELDCDGTQYLTENYSSDGIPYARLQAKWFSSADNTNYFGNGANYAQANYTNVAPGSNTFRLNVTTFGAATIADVNTGFGFATISSGRNTGMVGYVQGGIFAIDNVIGARTAPTAGTSGFSILDIRNSANTYHIFEVINTPTVTPGTYFTFVSSVGSFYMWFTVDGAGADPAPGGTGIQVNLLSTYSQNEIARCIQDALSGFQTTKVAPVIGSSVVPGSYFTITTPTPTVYYVWFTKDGSGADPQSGVNEAFKVKVNILSADSIATVVTKTLTAINMKYFATPDLRGLFLRGWNAGSGVDPDEGERYTQDNVFLPGRLGSFQEDDFLSHLHASGTLSGFFTTTDSGQPAGGPVVDAILHVAAANYPVTISGSSALTGGNETRPKNAYVRWIVKY